MKNSHNFQRLHNQPINETLKDFFQQGSAHNASKGLQDLWHNMFDEDATEDLSDMEISNLSFNLNKVVDLLHALEKHYIETHHEQQHQKIAMKLKELTNQNQSF